MKKIVLCVILLLGNIVLLNYRVFSQDISLIDINANDFPIIEAVFKTDQIESSSLPQFFTSDFSVDEKDKAAGGINRRGSKDSQLR